MCICLCVLLLEDGVGGILMENKETLNQQGQLEVGQNKSQEERQNLSWKTLMYAHTHINVAKVVVCVCVVFFVCCCCCFFGGMGSRKKRKYLYTCNFFRKTSPFFFFFLNFTVVKNANSHTSVMKHTACGQVHLVKCGLKFPWPH